MACQVVAAPGAAPASVAAADMSACPPGPVGRGSLVTKDPREVCRLSPRGDVALRLNPYPPGYGAAFACSPVLCPPPRRLALRRAFPGGGATGLSCSRSVAGRGGPCLAAGGAPSAAGDRWPPAPAPVPFWSRPVSLVGLSNITAVAALPLGWPSRSLLAPDRREAGSRGVG